MGIQGAFAALQALCEAKQPGSAARIFKRVPFAQAAEHFDKHGSTACIAATAYIMPDLHLKPWLAEQMFNAGAHVG
jgi:hypothetical protein